MTLSDIGPLFEVVSAKEALNQAVFRASDPESVMTFLLDVRDPASFVTNLPLQFRPPSQAYPHGGLPSSVWVGYSIADDSEVYPAVRAFERLLDVRARARWIQVSCQNLSDRSLNKLIPFFQAWRCPNCGHRGSGFRPRRCPHARGLCGDVGLMPQFHWLIADKAPGWFTTAAREAGMVVYPEVPR